MKKMFFVLTSVIMSVFLFSACEQSDGLKDVDTTDFSKNERGNNNDQGENEGNGKKTPVGNQPILTPDIEEILYDISDINYVYEQIYYGNLFWSEKYPPRFFCKSLIDLENTLMYIASRMILIWRATSIPI